MSAPSTPSGIISDNVDSMKTELLAVAGAGLGVGVVVFALKRGWRLLKGFTS